MNSAGNAGGGQYARHSFRAGYSGEISLVSNQYRLPGEAYFCKASTFNGKFDADISGRSI